MLPTDGWGSGGHLSLDSPILVLRWSDRCRGWCRLPVAPQLSNLRRASLPYFNSSYLVAEPFFFFIIPPLFGDIRRSVCMHIDMQVDVSMYLYIDWGMLVPMSISHTLEISRGVSEERDDTPLCLQSPSAFTRKNSREARGSTP